MEYERLLGDLVSYPEKNKLLATKKVRSLIYQWAPFEDVRGIEHTHTIDWDEHKNDIEIVLNDFIINGYRSVKKLHIDNNLKNHILDFQVKLDFYFDIVEDSIYCKDEYFYRCLSEGPAFAKQIKEERATSLKEKIALCNVDMNYDRVVSNYTGYDCILSENFLIYWDESKLVTDWIYALGESRISTDWHDYRMDVRRICQREKENISLRISQLEPKRGTKAALLDKDDKTTLARELWTDEYGGPYIALRRLVPTYPGHTRDTGVADHVTLNKVKMLNQIARTLGANNKHILNANLSSINKRIERIQKHKYFLHLDFKKFGLTFPRQIVNIILEELQLNELKIDDFIIITDEGKFFTKRGGVLGWFDGIVAIGISVILAKLRKQFNNAFDFVGFNDDWEIAAPTEELAIALKEPIGRTLEEHGFLISWRKTYVSKESILLEQYSRFEESGLDMSKMQLLVKHFSKSVTSIYPWQAKALYAEASAYYESTYTRERCMSTIKPEFSEEEVNWPVQFGGWTYKIEDGLDKGFAEATERDLAFYFEMAKFKSAHLTPKVREIDITDLLKRRWKIYNQSYTPQLCDFSSGLEEDPRGEWATYEFETRYQPVLDRYKSLEHRPDHQEIDDSEHEPDIYDPASSSDE